MGSNHGHEIKFVGFWVNRVVMEKFGDFVRRLRVQLQVNVIWGKIYIFPHESTLLCFELRPVKKASEFCSETR